MTTRYPLKKRTVSGNDASTTVFNMFGTGAVQVVAGSTQIALAGVYTVMFCVCHVVDSIKPTATATPEDNDGQSDC